MSDAPAKLTATERARLTLQIAELLEGTGLELEDLVDPERAARSPSPDEPRSGPSPTLAEYVPVLEQAYASSATETVRTYRTYWWLLVNGLRSRPSWDEEREREWLEDLAAVAAEWDLALDISTDPGEHDRVTEGPDADALQVWPGYPDRRLAELTKTEVQIAAKWVRARALAEGRRRDRMRAERGEPATRWTGDQAVELLIAATRALYEHAAGDSLVEAGYSPAARLSKPRRAGSRRRAMSEAELDDIIHVWTSTGHDPELDAILLKFHLATGARQEGAIRLKLRHLRADDATIVIPDKGSTAKRGNDGDEAERVPVPPSLIGELRTFAENRGAEGPQDSVFRYRAKHRGTGEANPPLTSRHYDSVHRRVRHHLAWAATVSWSTHWLRHHAGWEMEQLGGRAVKMRFLRHRPNGQTDGYGLASLEHAAWFVAMRTGEPHPKAQKPAM